MTFLVLMNIYLIGGIMYVTLWAWPEIQHCIELAKSNDEYRQDLANLTAFCSPKFIEKMELQDATEYANEIKDLYNSKSGNKCLNVVYTIMLILITLVWPICAIIDIKYKI